MKYSHLATRLFGAPLLMERGKLETIVRVFGQRSGIDITIQGDRPKAYDDDEIGSGSRTAYQVTPDDIAVISVMGPLVKRASGEFLSGGPTTYGELEAEFTAAVNNAAVRGILLEVDSPGGETVGCFELSDLIHAARGKKPIYAAADGDAFSAAYAIASAADQVFVTKSGGVGSVGVWMAHVDQSEFDKGLGVKVTYIFAGARKIDGNPHQPLSDEAYTVFKAEVDRIQDMFIETVGRNRGLAAKVVRDTEAGLFFGPNGVAIGFADQVGTCADALAALRSRIQKVPPVASATNSKRGGHMETPDQPGAGAPKPAPAAATNAADLVTARAEGFAHAAKIVGFCALAGFTAAAAQKFLKPEASIESVQQEITEARAANNGPEIHSHILPDAGADAAGKPESSPIVKAASKLAAAHKEGK